MTASRLSRRAWLVLPAAMVFGSVSGPAQAARVFPADALRGTMHFIDNLRVTIDGESARMGPGVQLRDQRNMLIVKRSLRGQTHLVNYRRDASGSIYQVWILTDRELQRDKRRSANNPTAVRPDVHFYGR